jgi:DNA-binding NarL/FixJ family response regulator
MHSGQKRILIVDDNAAIRTVSRFLLDTAEFKVCGEAIDGRDAIEKARELRPDLIVLDLAMPRMNGLDAARELTNLMPEIPLIMFTNHSNRILEEEAWSAGIHTVLSKSQPFEQLMDRARELLN